MLATIGTGRWHKAARGILAGLAAPALALVAPGAVWAADPPAEQAFALSEIALPPIAGAGCLAATGGSPGCIVAGVDAVELGGFLPDGRSLLLRVRLAGSGGNGRRGDELVLARLGAEGGVAGWKCLTCGLSPSVGAVLGGRLDHPQPFADGNRVLAGMAVFDCAPWPLNDDRCTAQSLRVYPVETGWAADPALRIDALRLHPGGNHVSMAVSGVDGRPVPFGWLAALAGDGQRYVLSDPQLLFREGAGLRLVRPGRRSGTLEVDTSAIEIESVSGFSADGREIFYRGFPWESGRPGLFAVVVESGAVRRLTRLPGGTGPVGASLDGNWLAFGSSHGSGQRMFLGGVNGLPPIVDLVSRGSVPGLDAAESAARDLVLIDREGSRGGYAGQVLIAASTGWSVTGAPAWSPDGRSIAVLQAAAGAAPARRGPALRLALVRLTGRAAAAPATVVPLPATIAWATPALPSANPGDRAPIPAGRYTLPGPDGGAARVIVERGGEGGAITGVSVRYEGYAADGAARINGDESASGSAEAIRLGANLAQAATPPVRKLTGPDGYVVATDPVTGAVSATGMMVTTIGERTYRAPVTGR